MKRKILIIGFGSAGQRFAKIIKEKFQNTEILILTKQKNIQFNTISNLSEIRKLNPEFIIISSPTKFHFKHLKFINKVFKNKKIFVEKPLFHKFKNIKNIKNNIFVGFNMRNLNIIKFLKQFIRKNKNKIYEINFINHSYLPSWRKNIDYRKSSSAQKKYAGGVILDCSHEIDLAKWILGDIDLDYVSKSKNSDLKINTEDNCKIFGNLDRNDLKILYYLSTIVLSFPLQAEGFGRVISEALVMKKKILAFNYGGVKDQLENLSDVYKVDPNKYSDIHLKLHNIIKLDDEKFSNISTHSRDNIIKLFSKSQMVKNYFNLYEQQSI